MSFWEVFLLLSIIGLILSAGAFVYVVTDMEEDIE